MSQTEYYEEEVASDLKPVRVVYRQLDYLTTIINPLGQEVDGIKTAYGPGNSNLDPSRHPEIEAGSQAFEDLASDFRRGQLIYLRPHQYVGLIKSGAVRDVVFEDGAGDVEADEEEELVDVNTATIDELADWMRSEKPTIQDVVNASNGEPDLARKLLEAESKATEGDPRKGVLNGLTAVISRG